MAGEKVLVVDDEIDVLDLCKRILEVKGYHPKTALNGVEAIQMAHREHFDLLLTDIRMPGMNGLEIAQAIKKSDPSIICVTMTGYSTMDMAIEALKLGIDEFIMKPFVPEELSMAITKALEKERLRKENFRLRSLIPLFELNKTLMATVEVELVLQRLLEISQQETQADFARLYTFDAEKATIQAHPPLDVENEQEQASYALAGRVLESGTQLILSLDEIKSQDYYDLFTRLQMESIIATPLKSKEANLGVLILARRENSFAPSDTDFLSVLAGQAGIALENARLFTEIQKAYQELKVLDHMKSEFINIAAHELRTPLTILMGYTTLLEDSATTDQQDYTNIIMRNAMRLRALIDDMLNLQALERGVPVLNHNTLDLVNMIQELIEDTSLQVSQKQLHLEVDIPPDFPAMIADRQKLDLIIINLLNNAIKFTPPGGHIILKARFDAEWVTVSVSDTGIGIPKEQLKRIFDRFYQVEFSLTREHGGIGLGLAIVRGMVDVCGGRIHVDTELGQGTTFSFTLPLDNTHVGQRKLEL